MKDIIKKSILFGLGAFQITKEEIEKFVKELQTDSDLTPEEGKKLVKELVADIEKTVKKADPKGKFENLFRGKGIATKKDIADLRKEIKKSKPKKKK
ncbi:MAG TPA: hypothetical protein ENI23_10290 [bacterium]|nr:hypothetical protein [bacterium]